MQPVIQIPTIDTSAYGAGDSVGGLLTFNFGKIGARGVIIKSAILFDNDSEGAELTLHLFKDASMVCADQSAFTVSQANMQLGKYLGNIVFTTFTDPVTTGKCCVRTGLDLFVPTVNGKFYGQLACTATPTYTAATDLSVTLHAVKAS